MFTGIIQSLGTVRERRERSGGVSFTISAAEFAARLDPGASVSVNGVCQTVEEVGHERFTFTAVGETLRRTTLDSIRPGERVNLEKPATPTTALGGHLVQGHVDGVGVVEAFDHLEQDRLLSVSLPEAIARYVVPKGSIAIDGVSLTVIDFVAAGVIRITIIPFTIENTIIGSYRKGTRVNVESDIVGKYVVEYLNRIQKEGGRRS